MASGLFNVTVATPSRTSYNTVSKFIRPPADSDYPNRSRFEEEPECRKFLSLGQILLDWFQIKRRPSHDNEMVSASIFISSRIN